jgi:predicted transcriptional regulator
MSKVKEPKTVTFTKSKADKDAQRPNRRSEQHGVMHNPFREVFYRKGLSLSARVIALWLYDHLKPGTNEATGSQELIASDLEVNRKTVRKAINELYTRGVIISIDRQQNSSGGFFNIYKMRIYEQKQRDTRKILKLVKPSAKQEIKKAEKTKPVMGETRLDVCPTCKGTGWEYNSVERVSRRCPACRKPQKEEKKP